MSVKRVLGLAWLIWAHGAGISIIALGLSWSLLSATTTPDRPVVEPINAVERVTTEVKVGGTVYYTLDIRRNDSCPGVVTNFFREVVTPEQRRAGEGGGTEAALRAGRNTESRTYPDAEGSIPLLSTIYPGDWEITISVDSKCATYRRVDTLLQTRIKVLP